MYLYKKILYPFFIINLLIITGNVFAQNTSWLKRSWQGKAFILGNSPEQNYDLILSIKKIKGNEFEGVLTTVKPFDTAVHFDTKITGTIFEKHMLVNIGLWKVSCGSCKPQNLAFTIESGKMYLKGEAKGCSEECTWITVFSKDLVEFAPKEQEELFAVTEEILPPALEETAAVESELPVRTPLLPAGAIIITGHSVAAVALTAPAGSLKKKPGIQLIETAVEKRTTLIPAGEVVAVANEVVTPATPKIPLDKKSSLSVNDKVPEKRTALIPEGAVVAVGSDVVTPAAPKMPLDRQSSLSINDKVPEKRTALIPAGAVVAVGSDVVTPAAPKIPLDRHSSLSINDKVPEKRTALMPAGAVVAVRNEAVTPAAPKVPLDKKSSLSVNDKVPEKRTVLIPAGAVVAVENSNKIIPGKPPGSLQRNPGLAVNTAVTDKRTALIPAGELVGIDRGDNAATQQKTGNLVNKPSVEVNNAIPEKRTILIPAGSIALTKKNALSTPPKNPAGTLQKSPGLAVNETAAKPKKIPVVDSASLLPEGYADRKRNVVSSLNVNADTITLRLYDNGVVDGDIVSVVYNDLVVVDKLSLVARALVIKIPVKKGITNKLVFHAHNLGEFPPNTAKLEILFGTKREELTIASDYTVSSAIDIVYTP